MAAIIEAPPLFIGTADLRGAVRFVRLSGKHLAGLDADAKVTALTISDFQPPWAAQLIAETGLPTARRDGCWSDESAVQTRTGLEVPVSQVIVAHRNDAGAASYFSTIMHDISQAQARRGESRPRRAPLSCAHRKQRRRHRPVRP